MIKKNIILQEEGQAMVESLIVLIILIGLLATTMFFGYFGVMTQKGQMGARIITLGTAERDYAFSYEPSDVNYESGSANTGQLGLDAITGFFGWLSGEGMRNGWVEKIQEGKIIGIGGGEFYTPFHTKFKINYTVDRNSWKVNPAIPAVAFGTIGGIIVCFNVDITEAGSHGEPDYDDAGEFIP